MKTYYILLILLIVLILYTINYLNRKVPIISDVSVINLERSKDRWYDIQLELIKLFPLKVSRWSATDGKQLTIKDMINEKIPESIYGVKGFDKPLNETNKYGVMGCYLSHKKLLKYLETLNVNPNDGHLILEDDIYIKSDTLTHWRKIYKNLNPNWDIVYFGVNDKCKRDKDINGFKKAIHTGWGTYGYMVKHSSIPKILEKIDVMDDAIDAKYSRLFSELNCYILSDIKIYVTDVKSTIQV